jgi:hypothetical protein
MENIVKKAIPKKVWDCFSNDEQNAIRTQRNGSFVLLLTITKGTAPVVNKKSNPEESVGLLF